MKFVKQIYPTDEPIKDVLHPSIAYLNTIDVPEQRTPAWYEARKGKLTASDVNTALGENPYKSREQLLLEKAGMPNEFKGNAATAHGQKYEDEACKLYEKRFGRKVYEYGLLPHPTLNYLAASPDGVTNEGELIEIKCPYGRKITPTVPPYYYGQIQLGMHVTGTEKCHFIQYRPSLNELPEEFVVVEVLLDQDWWDKNQPKMKAFCDEVCIYLKKGWKTHPNIGKYIDIGSKLEAQFPSSISNLTDSD